MPDIQTTDVGRKLQRRYQLLGPPPTPFLSPELVPVVIVDDLTDLDVLEATFERPCEGMATINAPAVGSDAINALVNPADSGIVATVEWVLIEVAVAMHIEVEIRTTVTANVFGTRGFRDTRVAGTPACAFFQGSEVQTTPTRYFFIHEPTQRDRQIFLPWVVAPGSALVLHAGSDNQELRSAWFWTERLIEAG